jgi:hypothetical protein
MNGQVIKAKFNGEPTLLNLGAAKYLRIFKTNEKLIGQKLNEFRINNCIGKECTSELIREIGLDKASQSGASVAFTPKNAVTSLVSFDYIGHGVFSSRAAAGRYFTKTGEAFCTPRITFRQLNELTSTMPIWSFPRYNQT